MTSLLMRSVRIVTVVVGFWVWLYLSIGNGVTTRDWYRSLGSFCSHNELDGALCANSAIPTLGFSALAILLTTSAASNQTKTWFRPTKAALFWVVGSTVLYLLAQNIRKLLVQGGNHLNEDKELMHIGNSFGLAAITATTYFLIPVAKQNPLWRLFGQDEVTMLQTIHIWAGYVVVSGSLIHGTIHMYRWHAYFDQSIGTLLRIPHTCWSSSSSYTCHDLYDNCTCDSQFRNLTGFMAGLCLLLVAITSLYGFRRRAYAFFYFSHTFFAPLSILFMVVHYNRAFMFLAPSLLFYLIISVSTVMESTSDLSILSVQRLGSAKAKRPCFSITLSAVDTTVEAYRAGQYVKLWCRALSAVSHPFTINKVPGQPRKMRIIFRVCGKFTYLLGQALTKNNNNSDDNNNNSNNNNHIDVDTEENNPNSKTSEDEGQDWPKIGLRGFMGHGNRLFTVQQNDAVLIIAGGIGITPYLTLLQEIRDTATTTTKHVTVHWVCRDPSLIKYIYEEYFETLLHLPTVSGVRLTVILHNTFTTHLLNQSVEDEERAAMVVQDAEEEEGQQGMEGHDGVVVDMPDVTMDGSLGGSTDGDDDDDDDDELIDEANIATDTVLYGKKTGQPFYHSRLAGNGASVKENLGGFLLFTLLCTASLWGLMQVSVAYPPSKKIGPRLIYVGFYAVVIVVAVVSARVALYFTRGRDLGGPQFTLISHSSDELDSVEMEIVRDNSFEKPDTDIRYEEQIGRPDVSKIIYEDLIHKKDCHSLAVFQCGPVALMANVREAVDDLNNLCCLSCKQERVELFEETFEM